MYFDRSGSSPERKSSKCSSKPVRELGIEHEARTVTKPFQQVEIRKCSTTMMMGTGQELLKRSPDE